MSDEENLERMRNLARAYIVICKKLRFTNPKQPQWVTNLDLVLFVFSVKGEEKKEIDEVVLSLFKEEDMWEYLLALRHNPCCNGDMESENKCVCPHLFCTFYICLKIKANERKKKVLDLAKELI